MKHEFDGIILELSHVNKKRILFVDDEELYVSMGSRMLRSQGYKVTAKNDGAEALEHFFFQPRDFDLVITGQTLPSITGMEFAQKLLTVRPDIPVILCTASSTIPEDKAYGLGIRVVMNKPFDTDILASTIRKLLYEK